MYENLRQEGCPLTKKEEPNQIQLGSDTININWDIEASTGNMKQNVGMRRK